MEPHAPPTYAPPRKLPTPNVPVTPPYEQPTDSPPTDYPMGLTSIGTPPPGFAQFANQQRPASPYRVIAITSPPPRTPSPAPRVPSYVPSDPKTGGITQGDPSSLPPNYVPPTRTLDQAPRQLPSQSSRSSTPPTDQHSLVHSQPTHQPQQEATGRRLSVNTPLHRTAAQDIGLPKNWLIAVDGSESSMKALMVLILELVLPIRRDNLYILLMKSKNNIDTFVELEQKINKLVITRKATPIIEREGRDVKDEEDVEDDEYDSESRGIRYMIIKGEAKQKVDVSDKILAIAKEKKINNIVLGMNAMFGMKQNKVGGVISRVLQEAPCVVSIVRADHIEH